MNKVFVEDISEHQLIETTFIALKKNVLMSKNGHNYINIVLADRTGTIEGRVWDNVEELAKQFEANDFVKLKGRSIRYQNKIQLNVTSVIVIDDRSIDIHDYLPASEKNVDDMFQELKLLMMTIKNTYLKQLSKQYLNDKVFVENFCRAPAAKDIHHSFLGGLLEHTLSLCQLADRVVSHYSFVSRDLVLIGAFLHDLGKIDELSYTRQFEYTTAGRLLGHLAIGSLTLDRKIQSIPEFPELLRLHVHHLVLSHHGELEFGSPKRPKTIEAMILHMIDNLDSKVSTMHSMISKEQEMNGDWTSYHRWFNRYFYKGDLLRIDSEISGNSSKKEVEPLELF